MVCFVGAFQKNSRLAIRKTVQMSSDKHSTMPQRTSPTQSEERSIPKPDAENGQFLGEILDVPGQPVLGGVGNEQQQRVKQSRHGVPASAGDNVLSDREIALFLYPVGLAAAMIWRRKAAAFRLGQCLFFALAVNKLRKSS
jgi:hypothetical protein